MMTSLKNSVRSLIEAILRFEARLVLFRYKPKVVAVTGSVGKTSAKDMLYAVLQSAYYVRKSEKSFNSDIGIPLAVLGCPNGWNNPFIWMRNIADGLALALLRNAYPAWLVLEVGADRPGDIKRIAKWLSPDIVVVTRLPDIPVHVEFFNSPEALFKEKSHLVRLARETALTVLNADDARVLEMRPHARGKVVTYGLSEGADVVGSHVKILYGTAGPGGSRTFPEGVTFHVDHAGHSVPISIFGVVGIQPVYAALAALATGVSSGVNLVAAGDALARVTPAPGRMRIISGLKETLLIDDTYNASPVATQEALATLGNIEHVERKIALLGDMLELGKYSAEEHKEIGRRAAGICDLLITVGFRARYIAEGALDAGLHESKILQFEDSRKAGEEVKNSIKAGDVILVKGSQSMRMERTVEELMAEPEKKGELLVRQEREWLERP